ncbi:metallophosphoesterase [Pseudobutyrivibrio sp. LB2011]|uniref:metallophosphoesterase n=1 Tax=Pseudobutyrivibrio sp. LB2011 TaxID=1408312 RepID=UPI0005D222B1|nr:metallophosphoesterase family protein [Pseudobutyrivibrio sp. LB2011]
MVFITGDCHSDFSKFNTKNFPIQKEMTKDDYVIICGDFGGVWNVATESKEETYLMDWLEDKPFTTLFVDGNHENFDRLNSYLVEEWHGGKVHKIRSSVIHLMRGQIYDIEGSSFFAFGGASSHDVDGGILEPTDPDYQKRKKYLDREWISYRINRISWWKEELASEEEMAEGQKNLSACDNKVDFIITHCAASSTQAMFSFGKYASDIQTNYLESIKQNVAFKKWYFGHYHKNMPCSDKEIMIYNHIERIL